MQLSISTWNINSVRLRLGLVERFLATERPDILCLQETKCPDDQFPAKALAQAGYPHQAFIGNKGYNGVAIVSRLPFAARETIAMCERADARHVGVTLAREARAAAGLTVHNFYVPAGGDVADPDINDKFAHKLAFLEHMRLWQAAPATGPRVLVGDLNIAPCEHDVWSHRQLLDVVSHTPVETEGLERLRSEGAWVDAVRQRVPEPEKVYTWWSYRAADWAVSNKGRRLDHVWLSSDLAPSLSGHTIEIAARGWERPSDHVPVTVRLDL